MAMEHAKKVTVDVGGNEKGKKIDQQWLGKWETTQPSSEITNQDAQLGS
jgi:hypothetical protein